MYLDQSLLCFFTTKQMYKDVQNSNNVDKQMLNQLVNENVIPYQSENTLKTYTKQNQNPRNESFGGFFIIYLFYKGHNN